MSSLSYRRSVRLGRGLRVNLSNRGASVSAGVGPVRLSTRGRGSVRLGRGLSHRFRSRGWGLAVTLAVVVLAVLLTGCGSPSSPSLVQHTADAARCRVEVTNGVRSALLQATSQADFDARMDHFKHDAMPPSCRGLTEAQEQAIMDRVLSDLSELIFTRALGWADTASTATGVDGE